MSPSPATKNAEVKSRKLFRFKSFRSRIIAFVLFLSVPIQLALFITIRNANITTARANIDEALQVTAEIFFKAIEQRRDSLLIKVRALSSDYAFKPAANTNEHKTVLSTLLSYQQRANADVMLLLSIEGDIIADTKHPELTAQKFYLPELIGRAMNSEYGEAELLGFIDLQPYLLVAVPLFSPEVSHWIVTGFKITDDFAKNLQQTTKSHVSLLFKTSSKEDTNSQWQQLASTLPTIARQNIESTLSQQNLLFDSNFDLLLSGKNYVSVALVIKENSKGVFIALLQRSLEKALAPYQSLHYIVASVFFIAIIILILGGIFIARKITRPVTILAEGAGKIEQGQYDLHIEVNQKDELGQLAQRFNAMAKGLAERAKVRSLLGKVVSPAIAEQLLTKGVELGGEDRQATILFCDIRNFTRLCEAHSAKQVITLLNELLSRLSGVIDQHHGVIDKYIGDAVMALFGVPVIDEQQAQHAVYAALAMRGELNNINKELAKRQLPEIGIGIGVNSASVVAGNMGSETRLNYTVIGDGVNLSSRLEGLTKYYGVAILVSEATKNLCPDILFQEIANVRVKGKMQGIKVYQPLGSKELISAEELKKVSQFHQALHLYKKQKWRPALAILNQLSNEFPKEQCFQIYKQRVIERQDKAFEPGWDETFTHLEK
jgi:adenylate cyclase